MFCVLQEKFVRFVRIAGLMADKLEEEQNRRVRGRPPLRLSMCGLYGAVSEMYVDPRSRLPNVLHLGGPPCVSTGSA